jgi:hypothetical protein
MNLAVMGVLLALALFAAMVLLGMLGFNLRRWMHGKVEDESTLGVGSLDAAVFGLLGLLLAFTFSGAAGRFDERRALIAQEANEIGTAYLRINLLPAAAQPAMRDSFRRYVDARLAAYAKVEDFPASEAGFALADSLQTDIWNQAVAATGSGPSTAGMLFLPAVNDMFSITTTRKMARMTHPPLIIFVMRATR